MTSFTLGLRLHAGQFTPDAGAQPGAGTADHLEATPMDGLKTLATAHVQPVPLPASVYI